MKVKVGTTGKFSKTITEHDVYSFAGITGDFNPIHINAEEAEKTDFNGRIVHGILVGGLISTVIGNYMPGNGSVYMEQNLKFKAPVFFNDTCTAVVTVVEIINKVKGIYKLDTNVFNQRHELVCEGYAVVKYKEYRRN